MLSYFRSCFTPLSEINPETNNNAQQATTTYPGLRHDFVKTAGNALAAAPPQSSSQAQASSAAETAGSQADGTLVSVTVPAGVSPGQTLHVRHPDGSGQLIEAKVPEGLAAGSVFYVRAPPKQVVAPSSATQIPNTTAGNTDLPTPIPAPVSVPVAEPVNDYSGLSVIPPPQQPATQQQPVQQQQQQQQQETTPFAQCLDAPGDTPIAHASIPQSPPPQHNFSSPPPPQPTFTAPTPPQPAFTAPPAQSTFASPPPQSTFTPPPPTDENNNPSNKGLLKVQVPPGTTPGSTLHVQIPGEDRFLAAVVPPNCSEFHVQYEKRQPVGSASQHQQQPSGAAAPPPGQKLLLVKVPRGTAPGTTLHVQVPNEPGRLLSAKVPQGNVREFHVSYRPRSSTAPANQNPPQYQSQPYHQQQQQQQQQGGYYGNRQDYNDPTWGSSTLPIAVGGLATGVAAAMVYDHFAHNHHNGGGQDNDYYGNDNNIYDAGDIGGACDY